MPIVMIKNMVCRRCIMAVEETFRKHGIEVRSVSLGEVDTKRELTTDELQRLSRDLEAIGFEVIKDRRSLVVERIKVAIVKMVQEHNAQSDVNLSTYLSETLNADYSALSNLFSRSEGMTIERYFILQRIELAKELLSYDELSIAQVSDKLGYSSPAHLSAQFKSFTGMTPKEFKKEQAGRKALDEVGCTREDLAS